MNKKIKISFSIMAHPSRKDWAEALANKIGCPIYYDTDNTIWNTCKGAWLLHEKHADYHFVIQDDAILCENFLNRFEKIFNKSIESNGETAFQLYYGRDRIIKNKESMKKAIEDGYFVNDKCAWGVAIGIPVKYIEEMIQFGDSYPAKEDDTKIKYFLLSKGIKTVFTIPCLVDHRKIEENPTLTKAQDFNKQSEFFIDKERYKEKREQIPKYLHQIWIGKKELMPEKMMKTWENMEGWEYLLWTEEAIDKLDLKNRKLYDYFYAKGCYYGCSDIVRLEVLERYGGVYIDADTERLQSIDEILRDCTFFSVWSNTEGRIANGVMGTIPNHPIIQNYIEAMGSASKVEPVWSTIGGTMFTDMISKFQDKYTKILKPISFYPFNSKGVKTLGRDKNYARHYWGSTHNLYGKI